MFAPLSRRQGKLLLALLWLVLAVPTGWTAEGKAKVYVVLWFDTEDYLLPASDDAALRIAEFLSREEVRATFKVVGEKARTLEKRGRTDVIGALKKHEIGYHSNYHSVQPTPAMYLSNLGWDEGVAEFDRRERPGYDDIKQILGTAPTCYGQPGSSWGPQSYGAMRKWGMRVYLDSGNHVRLADRPCYYCGILNLYKLTYTLRANWNEPKQLQEAEDKFLAARDKLLGEGGGIVSIFYHPCEFVHKEFWDGVNFKNGANPPRQQWKRPPQKSPEESKRAYQVFDDYVRFIKRFPEVQFVTASEAARLYSDRAQGRKFAPAELRVIAAAVQDDITFYKGEDYALAPSEVFLLLNAYVAERGAGRNPGAVALSQTPYGPTSSVPASTGSIHTDWSQFTRTAADNADFLGKQGRIPSSVWLGSVPVAPEAYLRALAQATMELVDEKPAPESMEIKPARLGLAANVADDGPNLWGWVIFPRGFRAPRMMALAKRQAWTLKPALLQRE